MANHTLSGIHLYRNKAFVTDFNGMTRLLITSTYTSPNVLPVAKNLRTSLAPKNMLQVDILTLVPSDISAQDIQERVQKLLYEAEAVLGMQGCRKSFEWHIAPETASWDYLLTDEEKSTLSASTAGEFSIKGYSCRIMKEHIRPDGMAVMLYGEEKPSWRDLRKVSEKSGLPNAYADFRETTKAGDETRSFMAFFSNRLNV